MFYAVALTFVVTMLGTTLPTPLYPGYQQVFGVSELMITVIYAVYAAGVIGSAIVTGRLSDQYGRRPLLLTGLTCSAASAVCFLLADNVAMLLLARVLSGASAGIFTSTATIAVIELAPDRYKSNATLAATVANMGGLGLGTLIAGVFAEFLPWPLRLVYVFDLCLVAAAFVVIIRAPETAPRPAQPGFAIQVPRIPAATRPVFVPAAIVGFAGFAVLGLFAALAPAFIKDILLIDRPTVVGSIVFVLFLASTVGQLGQARLREDLRLPVGCILLIIGMALVALGLGLASPGWLTAGAMVSGLGQGGSFRAAMGSVTAASPMDQRSEVASSFFIVVYVAISIPVIGLGFLANALGLVVGGVIFTSIIAALAAIALVWLIARQCLAVDGAT
ncbi:MFS transporter [Salinisphaera sp. USBA-960]|uniref:MFS transporter n=1 Tax=Salinisphaera orenii TaxID=856731 RepID=UPI000DBE5414|nr:MFS transporter [Salifodinibacter halophilus]NNC25418.1 MFS transporter [Salifodinibacter halophilus]